MITTAANDFAALILQRAKEHSETAQSYAVQYAQLDGPGDKAAFQRHTELANLYRTLHGEACRALHAVETEMRAKATGSAA